MGEYALYKTEKIKIGTCEDMLYLRADQRSLVRHLAGSIDVNRQYKEVRFRFPFPDEDGIEPGAFDQPDRALVLSGMEVPDAVTHMKTQFTNRTGYLVALPCPEDRTAKTPYPVHRNGFAGAVGIVQQRYWNEKLITVCKCMGCGVHYRLETLETAQPVIDRLNTYAMQCGPTAAQFYEETARRIIAGYAEEPVHV